ncbi:MAG: DUF4367 domain-containing protein [Oscillospiraceae bacterium]|nr:DUF4367 domain-containing protein [Oscillospiraceae bacterium]
MNNNVSFDAMLQMAAREAVYRQLDSFPSKRELEKMFEPTKTHEDKINKIIKKETRADKFAEFNRQFSKVAVILLITFTVTFTPLISAKAVRESIVQTVIEWKDEFASIFFKSENVPAVINDVKIGYMVEGFESDGPTYKTKYTYRKTYTNNFETININVCPVDAMSTFHTDNKHSDYYSISIDNHYGILVYRENYSILTISDDMFIYSIDGNISINELIEIYKNIEIL